MNKKKLKAIIRAFFRALPDCEVDGCLGHKATHWQAGPESTPVFICWHHADRPRRPYPDQSVYRVEYFDEIGDAMVAGLDKVEL